MFQLHHPRILRLHAVFLALVAFATIATLMACGSDSTTPIDYGLPPDPNIFNPGLGSGSGSYGSGNSGGTTGTASLPPPVCPDAFKACPHQFTYPYNGETSVELRGDFGGASTWLTGIPMTVSGTNWVAQTNVPYGQPVQYKFYVNASTWQFDPAQPTTTDANNDTNNLFSGTTCDPSVCVEPGPLPAGVFDWRDAVIYFVFVDRFQDGNPANNCNVPGVSGPQVNYMGGDWAGVTQQINNGYFTKLGVNTLWITVPVQNADTYAGLGTAGDTHSYSSYHGYWPTDLTQPEPCFGSLADLQGLVTAAHKNNLKVLFDFSMVLVQIGSPIYAQHNDWFWPNSFQGHDCICGQGCDWNAQGLQCWFADYLPHWNYTVADARNYSVNAAVNWITTTGIDGFRLDAIKQVDISWLTQLRAQITSTVTATQTPQQRFYMVGETYDFADTAYIASFVDPATKLDGQFDFPLRANIANTILLRNQKMSDLAAFMASNDYYYGANAVMSTWVGNADLPRIIHLGANTPLWTDQGDDGKNINWSNQPTAPTEMAAYQRVANSFALIFTTNGAPLIYYGDEIGMPGAGDPDNRRPMQFTGLSANQQFLHDRVATLLGIRAAHPSMRRGARSTLYVDSDNWVYAMEATGDTVYVAMNRSDNDFTTNVLPTGALSELVLGQDTTGPSVTIPARETRIFITK